MTQVVGTSNPLPEIGTGGTNLGQAIALVYDLPGPVRVRRLGDGLGSTYLINSSSGQFVARVNDPALRPECHFAYELELLSRLELRGLPVAGPYQVSGRRAFYATLPGPGGTECQLALYRFLRGYQPRLSTLTGEAMGRVLAEFHVATDQVSPPGEPPTLDRRELLEQPLSALRERLASPDGSLELNGEQALAAIEPVTSFLHRLWPNEGREAGAWGLIHGDYHHFNLREDGTGQMAILDFEHVALGHRAYDLATLIWGTFGRGGKAELWDAMVRGYISRRQLSELEAQTIPLLVCLRQLWWMGFHARHWGRWRRPWLDHRFFVNASELLEFVATQSCCYRRE